MEPSSHPLVRPPPRPSACSADDGFLSFRFVVSPTPSLLCARDVLAKFCAKRFFNMKIASRQVLSKQLVLAQETIIQPLEILTGGVAWILRCSVFVVGFGVVVFFLGGGCQGLGFCFAFSLR